MLLGTGIDVIRVSRIQQTLDRYGERFLNRVFTPAEIAYCMRKREPARSFAARFAAKEACFKAVGGTRRPAWRDMEIVNGHNGKPELRLHGRMARTHAGVHAVVALSHDGDLAVATVTAEKEALSP